MQLVMQMNCAVFRNEQVLSEAVNQEVETAIKEADAAPFPDPDSAFNGVYAH